MTSETEGATLASQLRSARRARCLTQAELADEVVHLAARSGKELSLSASAVSRWESGSTGPALRYRPFLSQILELDLSDLVVTDLVRNPTSRLQSPS